MTCGLRRVLGIALVGLLATVPAGGAAPAAHDHAGHSGEPGAADPHAAHRAALQKVQYSVSTRHYRVPAVELIDASGASVALAALLEGDQPVALNFIFTTCTTICPVMTATFASMRKDLGPSAERVQLVSISIDPEYDRPPVLKEYAEKFRADAHWTFLTGESDDISTVLRSFDAYAGSKMNHQPLTLLKSPGDPDWIRIDGLASGKDLAREIRSRLLD